MSDVIVIGVAGGTGSGKTTLVKALMNRFGDNISVLSHDNSGGFCSHANG